MKGICHFRRFRPVTSLVMVTDAVSKHTPNKHDIKTFLQLLMFYTAKAHKAIAIAQMPKYMYVYVGLSPCRIICVHV